MAKGSYNLDFCLNNHITVHECYKLLSLCFICTYQTGEVAQSYGYGASGQSSTAGMFNSYGESFGPGDVIGCFVVSCQSII